MSVVEVIPPPSGEPSPRGGATPNGDSGAIAGTAGAMGADAPVSLFIAAAVSALRSMSPESSREVEADGRVEGRVFAADVSALREKRTDDSLRAPVDEPPLEPAEAW